MMGRNVLLPLGNSFTRCSYGFRILHVRSERVVQTSQFLLVLPKTEEAGRKPAEISRHRHKMVKQ